MIKLLAFLFGLYSSQLFAFDCSAWEYPHTNITDQALVEQSSTQYHPEYSPEYSPEYRQGLLWRIRAASGVVSYLFGTIHLSDERVIEFSNFVEPYLAKVENFAMEVLITAETPVILSQKMFYFDGRELGDYLAPEVFNKTLELLRQHAIDDYSASRLKPWAAYMTLSVPPTDNNVPLDMHLLSLANSQGLAVSGLEKIEEQLAIFEELPIKEQVSLLTESICNYAENQAQIEVMLTSYLNQNLAGLAGLGEKYRTPTNESLLKRLLDDRNKVMAERLVPWLDRGAYFVAVGALHLPGKLGLLARLKEKGYQLEVVDPEAR